MAKNDATRVQTLIRETRSWLDGCEAFVKSNTDRLAKYLGDESLQGLGGAALALHMLGAYYGRKGVAEVTAGNADGWSSIHKAIEYHYRSMKIDSRIYFHTTLLRRVYDSNHNVTNLLGTAGCLLCYFLLTDRVEDQSSMVKFFLQALQTPGSIADYYLQKWVFEPFAIRLQQKIGGGNLPDMIANRDLGDYERIFRDWDSSVADGLLAICKRHVRYMEDRSQRDWRPEFANPPFDLLPLEVLAVQKVRKQLGLETPVIDHPLLNTGLEAIDFGEISHDPVLDQVDVATLRVFGRV